MWEELLVSLEQAVVPGPYITLVEYRHEAGCKLALSIRPRWTIGDSNDCGDCYGFCVSCGATGQRCDRA